MAYGLKASSCDPLTLLCLALQYSLLNTQSHKSPSCNINDIQFVASIWQTDTTTWSQLVKLST